MQRTEYEYMMVVDENAILRAEREALREKSAALLFELAQMRATEVRVQVHEAAAELRALLTPEVK